MATVTGFTAERMLAMEDATIIDGTVVGNDLILVTKAGVQINAGNVRGPQGNQGIPGPLTTVDADARYLKLTGGSVSGRITANTSEGLRIVHATGPFSSFYIDSTRVGYIQGQTDEFKLVAEDSNPITFYTGGDEKVRVPHALGQEILTLNGNPDCALYFRQSVPFGTVYAYVGRVGGYGLRASGFVGNTLLQSQDGDVEIQAHDSVEIIPGNDMSAMFYPQGHVGFGKLDELEDDVNGFLWRADWKSLRLTTNTDGAASIYLNRQGAATGTGGGEEYMLFDINGGKVGSITRSPTGVAYNNTSDYRIKTVKGPITGALERIKLLKPVRAVYKEDIAQTEVDTFVAHEVSPAVPEAVTGQKDQTDNLGNPIWQQLDMKQLVPLLVASVKELTAKVENLEARLAAT